MAHVEPLKRQCFYHNFHAAEDDIYKGNLFNPLHLCAWSLENLV